jgi:tetratricopeptide (TPR) repeat protein
MSLETLLADLQRTTAPDALRALRETLVRDFPQSDAAAEACYKIGLDALFRQRNAESAIGWFSAATDCKHPFWSKAARVSLGLCLFHQGKHQKAIFQLRKVGFPETPDCHSVTALSFIELIFAELGNTEEVTRTRKVRHKQLETLIESPGLSHRERGQYLFQHASVLRDLGDARAAKAALAEAKALGVDALGAELYRQVIAAASE